MHHGPEMSSVSLLIQPSSITPTFTPGSNEEEEMRIGKEKQGGEQEENSREREKRVYTCEPEKDILGMCEFVRDHT